MSDLLIFGVGPHAVEILDIVDRINRIHATWNVRGFVSQFEGRAGEMLLDIPIFDAKDAIDQYPDAFIVPDYEWPNKSEISRDRLVSIIDPSAFVSSTAQIGLGCVIYPHCYIGSNARIGDFLFCLGGAVINHNDVIEDHVTITSGVVLAGDVHVEANCYLGQSCTIREMLKIGRGSLIGMGAIVLHDVAPNSVMVGNPARKLRSRELNFPGKNILKAVKQVARKGIHALRRTSLAVKTQYGERFRPASE